MLLFSLVVMFICVQSNNGWGVAAGFFCLLISPLCDNE